MASVASGNGNEFDANFLCFGVDANGACTVAVVVMYALLFRLLPGYYRNPGSMSLPEFNACVRDVYATFLAKGLGCNSGIPVTKKGTKSRPGKLEYHQYPASLEGFMAAYNNCAGQHAIFSATEIFDQMLRRGVFADNALRGCLVDIDSRLEMGFGGRKKMRLSEIVNPRGATNLEKLRATYGGNMPDIIFVRGKSGLHDHYSLGVKQDTLSALLQKKAK